MMYLAGLADCFARADCSAGFQFLYFLNPMHARRKLKVAEKTEAGHLLFCSLHCGITLASEAMLGCIERLECHDAHTSTKSIPRWLYPQDRGEATLLTCAATTGVTARPVPAPVAKYEMKSSRMLNAAST